MFRIIITALVAFAILAPAANASGLRRLEPGHSVTYTRQCDGGRFFRSVHAWTEDGKPLRRVPSRPSIRWAGHTGYVSFNGASFRNGTDRVVYVAGWCSR